MSVIVFTEDGAERMREQRKGLQAAFGRFFTVRKKANEVNPSPCFYYEVCNNFEVVQKMGRGVCSDCAKKLSGLEYPLWNTVPKDWELQMR